MKRRPDPNCQVCKGTGRANTRGRGFVGGWVKRECWRCFPLVITTVVRGRKLRIVWKHDRTAPISRAKAEGISLVVGPTDTVGKLWRATLIIGSAPWSCMFASRREAMRGAAALARKVIG